MRQADLPRRPGEPGPGDIGKKGGDPDPGPIVHEPTDLPPNDPEPRSPRKGPIPQPTA